MTDTSDEQKLVNAAKSALLEGIADAAARNAGESALAMTEAYSILLALDVAKEDRANVARQLGGALRGRR